MELLLRGGDVQMVLRIQVLLKNAGHSIEINGNYDLPTREALVDCFADPECSDVLVASNRVGWPAPAHEDRRSPAMEVVKPLSSSAGLR